MSDFSCIPENSSPLEEPSGILLESIEEVLREPLRQESLARAMERARQIPQIPLTSPQLEDIRSEHEESDMALPAIKTPIQPLRDPRPRLWNHISHWMGEFTMRQRIALSGMAVTILLGLFLLWQGLETKSLSAMEQMAEKIRLEKTYRATFVEEGKSVQPDNTIQGAKQRGKMYWEAPCSYRVDFEEGRNTAGKMCRESQTQISFADKPGINIDHSNKKYTRQPARQGRIPPLMMLERLGNFVGEADRTLGDKEIRGKKTQGFQIDTHKIDPDVPRGTMMDVWIDQESHLPVEISIDMKKMLALPEEATYTMRIESIEWNVQLEPSLFDTTPPGGYTETSIPNVVASNTERVKQVVEALKIYSELAGGRYPQVKTIYGDTTRNEVIQKLGIAWPPRSMDQMKEEKFIKATQAARGFAEINVIQRDNPDAAYHGKTVTPKDKDKVLLRWKLDNGKSEVIFGDLSAEIVTVEKLQELEGKSK